MSDDPGFFHTDMKMIFIEMGVRLSVRHSLLEQARRFDSSKQPFTYVECNPLSYLELEDLTDVFFSTDGSWCIDVPFDSFVQLAVANRSTWQTLAIFQNMGIYEIFNTPSNRGGGGVGAFSCFTNASMSKHEFERLEVLNGM